MKKEELESLTSQGKDLEVQIGKLKAEQTATQSDVDGRKKNITDLNNRAAETNTSIKINQKKLEDLQTTIANLQSELKELKSDKNLFPVEVKDFVNQGAKNITSYWVYSIAPLLIFTGATLHILSNSVNLLSSTSDIKISSVFAILITRLPYVILMSAIIIAAYKILHFMISEVIRINRQRLNLTKIGIIAKDVIESSTAGLDDLTEEQIAAIRTKLKMDMLRDHLKNYLSDDFEVNTKKFSFEEVIKGLRINSASDSKVINSEEP